MLSYYARCIFRAIIYSVCIFAFGCFAIKDHHVAQAQPKRGEQTDTKAKPEEASSNGISPSTKAGTVTNKQNSERAKYDPDCTRPSDHDEADLCVQRDMAESAHVSLQLAQWQTVIGGFGLFFVVLTLAATALASRATAKAADEARKSNQINLDAMMIDQRAWISISVTGVESFEIDKHGNILMPISIKISNIGKSPAHNIRTDVKLDAQSEISTQTEELIVFSSFDDEARPEHCRSLMPGESYIRRWNALDTIGHAELGTGRRLAPSLYICVRYNTIFDKSLHRSASAFTLGRTADDMYNPIMFEIQSGDASEIDLIPSGVSIID